MEQTPYINFDLEFSPNSDDSWSSAEYMVYRTNMYSMDIVTPHNINYLIKRLQEVAVVEQNNLANCSKQSSSEMEQIKPQSSKNKGDKKKEKKEKKRKNKNKNIELKNVVQDNDHGSHKTNWKFVGKLESIPEESFQETNHNQHTILDVGESQPFQSQQPKLPLQHHKPTSFTKFEMDQNFIGNDMKNNDGVDQFDHMSHLPNHNGLRSFNSMTNLTESIETNSAESSDYSGATTIVINGLANQMNPSSSNEASFTTIESDETDIDLMFELERAKMGLTFQSGSSQIEAAASTDVGHSDDENGCCLKVYLFIIWLINLIITGIVAFYGWITERISY